MNYSFCFLILQYQLHWICIYFSACNGMPTAITSPLAPVTKQFDCGMYRVGSVSAFLLAIGVWFCHWPCHLMVDIWHLVMKTALSWCGTSQVAAAYHLWWDTIRVYGHLPSGANPGHLSKFPKSFLNLVKFYFIDCYIADTICYFLVLISVVKVPFLLLVRLIVL